MLWGVSRSARRTSQTITIRWRSRYSAQIAIQKWDLQSCPTCLLYQGGRVYSSSSRGGERDEGFESWAERDTVEVRAGSAGNVKVDIFNPSLLSNPATPLLIYLPPTGAHLSNEHAPIPPYLLTSHSSLARINYRWNIPPPQATGSSTPQQRQDAFVSPHNHPFPIPIHDTLIAYSHFLSLFNPSPTPPPTPKRRKLYISPPSILKHNPRPILIYGSFLGGSLATSLALTESFASKTHPFHISGLICKSGIYDWVTAGTESLASAPTTSSFSSHPFNSLWDINTLISLREHLFSSPVGCFDAFASPTLFFRTAGVPVPKSWSDISPSTSPENEKRVSTSLPDADPSSLYPLHSEVGIWDDYDDSNPSFLNSGKGKKEEVDLDPVAKRSHLKFPAKDSGLKIPRALFLYKTTGLKGKRRGEECKQAEDMATLMRRSIIHHEFKERVQWDEDLDPKEAAAERVKSQEVPSSKELEERVVRDWIEDSLG